MDVLMAGVLLSGLDALGVAAWAMVAAGFTVVAAFSLSPRPQRPKKLPFPAESGGQQPLKIAHSQVYTPPPHRLNYRSNCRRR